MREPENFGLLLRRYRLAASLTPEALGERGGLRANAIAALERGRRRAPRPATVLLLADGLDLGPAERALLIGAIGAISTVEKEGVLPRVPVPLTSFIGRAHELEQVRQLLDSTRLLMLVGPAGVGETRLAIEVAHDVDAEVRFVELAPLADGAEVPHAVASTLGIQEQPRQSLLQTLGLALQSRDLVLVLDNCEHLLHFCAELAGTLLRGCPRLRVLATSGEPLGMAGEVVWSVPALSLPRVDAPFMAAQGTWEAVSHFVERARAVSPEFVLTEQNVQAIAEAEQGREQHSPS
jgi:transcriptional regulator with XRE-family HTH domain